MYAKALPFLSFWSSGNTKSEISFTTAETILENEMSAASTTPDFTDIDADHGDPQLCSLYASEIYRNLHVAEVGSYKIYLCSCQTHTYI